MPTPDQLELVKLTTTAHSITAIVQSHHANRACPLCHRLSSRIHSRYIRHLLDLPWHGVAMHLEVHVCRFFCDDPACSRQIFTERLPALVAPYSRRTARLDDWFSLVGLALGGEAGARLLRQLGMGTSPDALHTHIHSLVYSIPATPRVVGIDEFAFRRGRVFSTILVDLETRRVIDLLPDCEMTTIIRWLQAHPRVEIVSRDRATNFGEAIRQGAPQATQVADRWHVLENLGKRLETLWREHKTRLQTPRQVLLDAHPPLRHRTDRMERRSSDYHQNRVDLYDRIKELRQRGLTPTSIATLLQITRHTAAKYAALTAPLARQRSPDGTSLAIVPFLPYLMQRWNDGCRNASQLWREMVSQGFTQSAKTVSRFVQLLRQESGTPRAFQPVSPTMTYDIAHPPLPALTPRQAAKLFQRAPSRLTPQEHQQLDEVRHKDAVVFTTYEQVQAFCQIVRTRHGEQWEAWLTRVETAGTRELQAFAAGIRKDQAAMTAGCTLPYSQGPVENNVHRVKLIKRSGYGKMSFPTLRQRVLLPQAS